MSPTSTPEGVKIVEEIKSRLRGLVVATLILFAAITAVAIYSYSVSHDNQVAVCRLRDDLESRINASKKFVSEHPDKLREFGFTKAQISKEIENQEHTLDALSVVSCG